MLLLGRFLQGAGAIGSVVSAMIAELVKRGGESPRYAIMGGQCSKVFLWL